MILILEHGLRLLWSSGSSLLENITGILEMHNCNFHLLGAGFCIWLLDRYTQFSSVQLFSRVRLFATPWIAARQASLSITNSWSSLRLRSIKSVMPSKHLILCHPLLLLPPIPPSIRVFFSESTLRMRWPKVLRWITQSWIWVSGVAVGFLLLK